MSLNLHIYPLIFISTGAPGVVLGPREGAGHTAGREPGGTRSGRAQMPAWFPGQPLP